jgi:hypothetical protein
MPDETTDRTRQDELRLNVNEPHEVRYWTQRMGCSEQELRAAVALGWRHGRRRPRGTRERLMVKRVVLMLAIWLGWSLWQRAHGRSPEDPGLEDGPAPLSPHSNGRARRQVRRDPKESQPGKASGDANCNRSPRGKRVWTQVGEPG